GCGRAHLREEGPTLAMRGEIAVVIERILAGQVREALQVDAEAFELGVDHRIGAVGGDHPSLPITIADCGVVLEWVKRRLGRGDHLYSEALEEGSGAECLVLKRL